MSSIPSLILSLAVLRRMVGTYFSFLLTFPSLLTLHLLDMFWSGWNRQRIKWREEIEAFIEYDWPWTLGSWIRFISSLVDTFLVLWSFHHQRLYLHCYLDPEKNILFQMENLYGSHVNLQLPTAGFLHFLMDSSQDCHMPGLSLCLCVSVSVCVCVCPSVRLHALLHKKWMSVPWFNKCWAHKQISLQWLHLFVIGWRCSSCLTHALRIS